MPTTSAENRLALIRLVKTLPLSDQIRGEFEANVASHRDDPDYVGRELLGRINAANPLNPAAVNPAQPGNFDELLEQIRTAATSPAISPVPPPAPPEDVRQTAGAELENGHPPEEIVVPEEGRQSMQPEHPPQQAPDPAQIFRFGAGVPLPENQQQEEQQRNQQAAHNWAQHVQALQAIWITHAPHAFRNPKLPNGVTSQFHEPSANQFDVHTDLGTVSYTRDAVTLDNRHAGSMDPAQMKALVLTAQEHGRQMWPGHSTVMESNDRPTRFAIAAHMLASGVALVGNPPPFQLNPPLNTDLDMTAIITEAQRLKGIGLYPQTPAEGAGPTIPPLPAANYTLPQPVV